MDYTDEYWDDVISDVMTSLIPAIEMIDGQCGPCIRNFISDANEELEKLKIRHRYNFVREKIEGRLPTERVEVVKV